MSVGQSIRSSTKWVFFGGVGSQFLRFAFGVILARLLVPSDFGALVTIQIFTGLVGYIAGGGMGQALVQSREVNNADYQMVFTLQLLVGFIIYVSFFITSPLIAIFFNNPIYSNLLKVSALSFIIRPFSNIPNSKLFREMRFKENTYIQFFTLIVSSLISITMAYFGYGVWSLIWGGLIGSIAGVIVVTSVSRWRPGFCFNFTRIRELASYGFKISANDLVLYMREQTSNFILSQQSGASVVGIFNKANSLSQMPNNMVSGAVYHPVFRALSKHQDNLDKSRYLYFHALTLVCLYSLPFYVGLLWLADPFVLTVYGAKWQASAQPLFILALCGLFYAVENQSGAVVAAQNRLGIELRIQIVSLILMSGAVFIGLRFGLIGVAWGLFFVYAFNAVAMSWLAQICLKAHWRMLFDSLSSVLFLNASLFIVLLITDKFIHLYIQKSPLLYMSMMFFIGAGAYSLMFLFIPFVRLDNERAKWKHKIRSRNQYASK